MSQRPHNARGFTLIEVIVALAIFALAVMGLITALNTGIEAALNVRHRSLLREELESQLATRMGIPLDQEKFVIDAKDNRGIQVVETIESFEAKDQNGDDVQNLKKLTITASMGTESDSATILVDQQ